ncbi:MAG: YfhO family protein [bacterium]
MRRPFLEYLPFLLCVAILLLFTWPIAFLGRQPFWGDIPAQFLPWKAYAKQSLASGHIPLWNPYTYGGSPFLANLQSAVFYPIDLLLFPLPIEYHFGCSLILHALLSLWLTYLLGMSCGLSRWASSIAAVAYSLNGFVMIHIMAGNHLTYTAIAWAPGLLWAASRALNAPRLRRTDCAVFTLLMALQLLCGHPQIAFYSFFFTAVFILAFGLTDKSGWNPSLRALLAFGIGGLVAALLCAFQIFPTLEYIPLSGRRSPIGLDQATEFSFSLRRLPALFAGEYFGSDIWRNHRERFYYWSSAYGGAIVPVLAIFGLAKWRTRRAIRRGLIVMGLLALFLACGRDNPLYRFVLMLPGFKYFRAPAKYLPWFILPISLFAGYGLDRLVDRLRSLPEKTAARRNLTLPGVTVLGVLLGIVLITQFIEHQSAKTASVVRISACAVALGYYIIAVCWYLGARQFPRLRGAVFSGGMLLLLALDLWLFGHKYIDICLAPAEEARLWLLPPPEISRLIEKADPNTHPYRIALVGKLPYPNLTIPWKLQGLSGYDPMSLRNTMDLLAASEGWKPDRFVDSVELRQVKSPVYDLFNVQYILTVNEPPDPDLELVTQGRHLQIYKRKKPIQAVRWVGESEVTYHPPSESERAGDELLRLSWNHVEINAFPPEDIEREIPKEPAGEGKATVSAWTEEEVVLRYESPRDGWLVLSLPWHPGWKASVDDGVSQTCTRAMHALSAVRAPGGTHEVSVRYQPDSWRWGCAISSFTAFVLAVWGLWILTTRRRVESG